MRRRSGAHPIWTGPELRTRQLSVGLGAGSGRSPVRPCRCRGFDRSDADLKLTAASVLQNLSRAVNGVRLSAGVSTGARGTRLLHVPTAVGVRLHNPSFRLRHRHPPEIRHTCGMHVQHGVAGATRFVTSSCVRSLTQRSLDQVRSEACRVTTQPEDEGRRQRASVGPSIGWERTKTGVASCSTVPVSAPLSRDSALGRSSIVIRRRRQAAGAQNSCSTY